MRSRIIQHIGFWSAFVLLYASVQMSFAGPSDMKYSLPIRFLRFVFSELALLPWKILPFYVLFYVLIPRYFGVGKYGALIGWLILVLIVSVFGYRSMVHPISSLLYDEVPDFNVYSLRRLAFTLTDILPALALASTAKLLKGRLLTQQKLFSLQSEKKEVELGFLKAQMNPHFLFNTLNNLYGIARKDAQSTAPYILQLSHLMRYLLNEGQKQSVPIEKEILLIKDYIQLEQLRYGDRLVLEWDEKIDDYQTPIPPLLLLPFVENAFKHGISETRFSTLIKVEILLHEGDLLFELANAYDEEQKEVLSGLGLKNIKRQLQLLFDDQYDLNIHTESGLFIVQLKIQLNGTASIQMPNH